VQCRLGARDALPRRRIIELARTIGLGAELADRCDQAEQERQSSATPKAQASADHDEAIDKA
jgi:hypothetical protein